MRYPYFLKTKDSSSQYLYYQIVIAYYQKKLYKAIDFIYKKQKEIHDKKNKKWTGWLHAIKYQLLQEEQSLKKSLNKIELNIVQLPVEQKDLKEESFSELLYQDVINRTLRVIDRHIKDKNLPKEMYIPNPNFVRNYLKEAGFSNESIQEYDQTVKKNFEYLSNKIKEELAQSKSVFQITNKSIGNFVKIGYPIASYGIVGACSVYAVDFSAITGCIAASSTAGIFLTSKIVGEPLFIQKAKESSNKIKRVINNSIDSDLLNEKQQNVVESNINMSGDYEDFQKTFIKLHNYSTITQQNDYCMHRHNLVYTLNTMLKKENENKKTKKDNFLEKLKKAKNKLKDKNNFKIKY